MGRKFEESLTLDTKLLFYSSGHENVVFRASSWVTKKVEFLIFRQILFIGSVLLFMGCVYYSCLGLGDQGGFGGSGVFWGVGGSIFTQKRNLQNRSMVFQIFYPRESVSDLAAFF